MKKFLKQLIIFALIASILYECKPFYLLLTDKYKSIVAGSEIYHSLEKSRKKNKSKILVLGDSVGKQLIDNYTNNDTINSLACNQAIAMLGQYILLDNYLRAGNRVDSVFLIFTPFSFKNNLDQVYTFHYFLKPFYKEEYYPDFSKTVDDQIRKIPYHDFCWFPNILTSNWAPDFTSRDKIDNAFLSPISVAYLKKIKALSAKYHFKFAILPTPTKESNRTVLRNINNKDILKNGLEKEFKYYFKNIFFLNDSNFTDNVHLKDSKTYTELYKNKYLRAAKTKLNLNAVSGSNINTGTVQVAHARR